MAPRRIAVLDIGSNSAHLRVIEAVPGAPPLAVFRFKAPTRIAEAIDAKGELSDAGMRQVIDATEAATSAARHQHADELIVIATTTLRQAGNADQIHERIREVTGIEPHVITGEDEARLVFFAAHRWLGWTSAPLLILDIGGGSTEVAYGRHENPDWAVSLPIGAGSLTRSLLPEHPAPPRHVKAAKRHAADVFATIADRLGPQSACRRVIGASKTFKQLARLGGAPSWRRGPRIRRALTRESVREHISMLSRLSPEERAQRRGVAGSRARQILAGAIIANAAMKSLGVKRLDVIGWGLREGILLRRLDMLNDPSRPHF